MSRRQHVITWLLDHLVPFHDRLSPAFPRLGRRAATGLAILQLDFFPSAAHAGRQRRRRTGTAHCANATSAPSMPAVYMSSVPPPLQSVVNISPKAT